MLAQCLSIAAGWMLTDLLFLRFRYLVLLAGFYYAPSQEVDEQRWPLGDSSDLVGELQSTTMSSTDPLPLLMSVAAHFRGLFA
jgi:hypothetical protein